MPRKNTKSELFQHITEVGVFRDASGGGSSTIASGPPVAGAKTVVTVGSGTNFATGDWARFRAVDNYPEITKGSWAAAVFTPYYNFIRAAIVGDPVVEQTQTPLGHIEKSGIKIQASVPLEEVMSATRRLSIGNLKGVGKISIDFSVLGFNLENWLAALGMLDTSANIGGTQTSIDPLRAFFNGSQVKEQNDLCWYVNSTRKDGRQLTTMFMGCEMSVTKLKSTLARGKTAAIPISLVPTHCVRFEEID